MLNDPTVMHKGSVDDGLRLHLVSLGECVLLWLNFGVFCSSSTLPT